MHIYSDFSDYYDTAMRHFSDDGLTYVRRTATLTADSDDVKRSRVLQELLEAYDKMQSRFRCRTHTLSSSVILFCGKPFVLLSKHNGYTGNIDTDYERYYSERDAVADKDIDNGGSIFYGWDMFGEHAGDHIDAMPVHNELMCPVILIKGGRVPKIVLNPILRNIQFYKVFDVFSAHYELASFLQGVHEERADMECTETEKLAQKGMNGMSFKRASDTRKRKQKNKRSTK